jgi:hypothetical protein
MVGNEQGGRQTRISREARVLMVGPTNMVPLVRHMRAGGFYQLAIVGCDADIALLLVSRGEGYRQCSAPYIAGSEPVVHSVPGGAAGSGVPARAQASQ